MFMRTSRYHGSPWLSCDRWAMRSVGASNPAGFRKKITIRSPIKQNNLLNKPVPIHSSHQKEQVCHTSGIPSHFSCSVQLLRNSVTSLGSRTGGCESKPGASIGTLFLCRPAHEQNRLDRGPQTDDRIARFPRHVSVAIDLSSYLGVYAIGRGQPTSNQPSSRF